MSSLLINRTGCNLYKLTLSRSVPFHFLRFISSETPKEKSEKRAAPQVSLRKDILQKTPIGKLDEFEGKHPEEEKEPLPEFPGGVNPETGEIGGPRGPEPTRYGDWERKGRVSDF